MFGAIVDMLAIWTAAALALGLATAKVIHEGRGYEDDEDDSEGSE